MDNVPLLFLITIITVAVVLVVVGLYIVLVLSDLRKTIRRVNHAIETNPQLALVLKTEVTEAMQPTPKDAKKTKKRSYTRSDKPTQFRGV